MIRGQQNFREKFHARKQERANASYPRQKGGAETLAPTDGSTAQCAAQGWSQMAAETMFEAAPPTLSFTGTERPRWPPAGTRTRT